MGSKCDFRKSTCTGRVSVNLLLEVRSTDGVHDEVDYVKYVRSTEEKSSHILVLYGTEYRIFQNRVEGTNPYPYLHSGLCPVQIFLDGCRCGVFSQTGYTFFFAHGTKFVIERNILRILKFEFWKVRI